MYICPFIPALFRSFVRSVSVHLYVPPSVIPTFYLFFKSVCRRKQHAHAHTHARERVSSKDSTVRAQPGFFRIFPGQSEPDTIQAFFPVFFFFSLLRQVLALSILLPPGFLMRYLYANANK